MKSMCPDAPATTVKAPSSTRASPGASVGDAKTSIRQLVPAGASSVPCTVVPPTSTSAAISSGAFCRSFGPASASASSFAVGPSSPRSIAGPPSATIELPRIVAPAEAVTESPTTMPAPPTFRRLPSKAPVPPTRLPVLSTRMPAPAMPGSGSGSVQPWNPPIQLPATVMPSAPGRSAMPSPPKPRSSSPRTMLPCAPASRTSPSAASPPPSIATAGRPMLSV